jgi:hypothetical protein
MTAAIVTSFKKAILVFEEDSVQIPTQRSRIPRFRSDIMANRLAAI